MGLLIGEDMEIFTVAFFGHRYVDDMNRVERRLQEFIRDLLGRKEYVEFLVGRNGEFDLLVSSSVRIAKREIRDDNSSLTLVLPYPTAEYLSNQESFEAYYDAIELCEESNKTHFKGAIQKRNQCMIDRADLIVVYVNHSSGGAYQAMRYAKRKGKRILNLAEVVDGL